MKRMKLVALGATIAVAGIVTALLHSSLARAEQAQPAAKPAVSAPPTAAPVPPQFGKAETASWSATTIEAATAEANKNVLAGGKVTTVTGEVVDVSCYLQLGKRGDAHVACGTKCIQNGQPIGLVDAQGALYLLIAEEHHPRRDGEVDLKTVFLPQLAKTVTVTGMATKGGGYNALFVHAADIGAMKPKPMGEGTGKN